jgi:hypothetical protein
MSLYKQRGSNVWWFEFEFAGKRYRESAKTTSKTVAGDALKARRRQVEETFNGIKKREMPKTFSVAADEFKLAKEGRIAPRTIEILEREIAHLRRVFRRKLLIDIAPADIKKYKDDRLAAGVSRRGVNMDLEALRAILRRNGLWERIRPDFSMLRLTKIHGKALTQEEETLLLDACAASISRVLYPTVLLALCTGMRF